MTNAPDSATRTNISPLLNRFHTVRQRSEAICSHLANEDYVVQPIANVSPPKWHLAHTSWFFETFILKPMMKNYRVFHPMYDELFNSYYQTVGATHPRPQRGHLSRPTVKEIYRYRQHVDAHMGELLCLTGEQIENPEIRKRLTLGLHHEQQHQELLLTDIKYILGGNPLRPAYMSANGQREHTAAKLEWIDYEAGIYDIGVDTAPFSFDNETPRHPAMVPAFRLANRPVTNGEYLEFIEDNGYQRVELWLSDGWDAIQAENWRAPLYWEKLDGQWWQMTLTGMQQADEHAPVCHISYYEADAYARWRGQRLPTEAEWEVAAQPNKIIGNFYEQGYLQPLAAQATDQQTLLQIYGDVWEWTQSPYAPYPGFKPLTGSLGEYNGKFMCNQLVLRGGSCVTPQDHIRYSYRNFFYPVDRWQFSGLRLAGDIE